MRRINSCGHTWYVSDSRELFELVTLAPFPQVFACFVSFVGNQSFMKLKHIRLRKSSLIHSFILGLKPPMYSYVYVHCKSSHPSIHFLTVNHICCIWVFLVNRFRASCFVIQSHLTNCRHYTLCNAKIMYENIKPRHSSPLSKSVY